MPLDAPEAPRRRDPRCCAAATASQPHPPRRYPPLGHRRCMSPASVTGRTIDVGTPRRCKTSWCTPLVVEQAFALLSAGAGTGYGSSLHKSSCRSSVSQDKEDWFCSACLQCKRIRTDTRAGGATSTDTPPVQCKPTFGREVDSRMSGGGLPSTPLSLSSVRQGQQSPCRCSTPYTHTCAYIKPAVSCTTNQASFGWPRQSHAHAFGGSAVVCYCASCVAVHRTTWPRQQAGPMAGFTSPPLHARRPGGASHPPQRPRGMRCRDSPTAAIGAQQRPSMASHTLQSCMLALCTKWCIQLCTLTSGQDSGGYSAEGVLEPCGPLNSVSPSSGSAAGGCNVCRRGSEQGTLAPS